MTEAYRFKKTATLKPVKPIPEKQFAIKYLPRAKYPPLPVDERPPWNNDTWVKKYTSNRFEKFTQCRTSQVEVPCPDYTCFKACQYTMQDDKAVPDGEVVLLRKNYKVAPWCNPKIHTKQIKHCVEFICGSQREFDIEMPHNYRDLYLDENAMTKVEYKGRNEGRKAFIYVPSDQPKESDKTNDRKTRKVFYESELANPIHAKQPPEPNEQRTYKMLDQYALVVNNVE